MTVTADAALVVIDKQTGKSLSTALIVLIKSKPALKGYTAIAGMNFKYNGNDNDIDVKAGWNVLIKLLSVSRVTSSFGNDLNIINPAFMLASSKDQYRVFRLRPRLDDEYVPKNQYAAVNRYIEVLENQRDAFQSIVMQMNS